MIHLGQTSECGGPKHCAVCKHLQEQLNAQPRAKEQP